MTDNKIERCYNSMFNCIQWMGRKDNVYFFEHYVEFLDCFLLNDFSELLQSFSDEDKIFFLENVNSIRKYDLGKEEKRKVSQLILLKGATLNPLQPNHQLTPDTIGFIFVYLIESLIGKTEKTIHICDLAVGSGNLLSTVMTNLQIASISTVGVGVDADELLLNIASVTADWIDLDVQLYLQDGLMPLIGDSSDIAICDLPVGYYPDDERATDYRVCSEEGHTYSHHILMEQSMRNVRDNGFGLFLVPSNLFSSEQTHQLMRWLGHDVSLRAILQLPESLFKTKNSQKNIIIVQNEAPNTPVDNPLLARIPSLKKQGELADFFATFNSWAHELLNRHK